VLTFKNFFTFSQSNKLSQASCLIFSKTSHESIVRTRAVYDHNFKRKMKEKRNI